MIRLRLGMLSPLSTRCSWKRRTSATVAVSGERFKNAANRRQLYMWLRCEWCPSLRTHVFDHALAQRADGGISTHGELLLSEVYQHLIFLRTGLPTPLSARSQPASD